MNLLFKIKRDPKSGLFLSAYQAAKPVDLDEFPVQFWCK